MSLAPFALDYTLRAFRSRGRTIKNVPNARKIHEEIKPEQKFFTDHEFKTVKQLSNMVIPSDKRSGNAVDAGVPEFIDLMMRKQPSYQTEMRGGLKWLDAQCLSKFDKAFIDCNIDEKKTILDEIAYPENAKPEMEQGVHFFNVFRNFTASGFWTSKMGIKDLQYMGNKVVPGWDGCPDAACRQLGVTYEDNGFGLRKGKNS